MKRKEKVERELRDLKKQHEETKQSLNNALIELEKFKKQTVEF